MFTSVSDHARPLGHDLILKSIHSEQDIDRLAAFNAHIHDERLLPMTQGLIRLHPNSRPEYWLFVEEVSTGRIISSLCLIPWHWRYEEVVLHAGEMGIVGTLAEYRHRGLIRALVARFKELLHEGQFDLSMIEGIPYFYRQFGYEYALPLEAQWRLQLHCIPPASEADKSYRFRPATEADIPDLMRLYEESTRDLGIAMVRTAPIWAYLVNHVSHTANLHETWMVEDASGALEGWFATDQMGFGEGLIVAESAQFKIEAAGAVLRELKRMSLERGKPDIRLNLPEDHLLLQLACQWHAHDQGTYAWQIHLPDVGRLLTRIAPVLERRIAHSPFAGLTQTFTLNLYREAYNLHWQNGKLRQVESIGFSEEGAVRIPPLLFAPLLLGYRSLDELRHFAPDVSVWGEAKLLVKTLFPQMTSFLYTQY